MAMIFVVRAENRGEPESYLCGLYPTEELALARIETLENDDGFDAVWYDAVKVDALGADVFLSNR